MVKENHLSGHVVSIPIGERKGQPPSATLPRQEYSEYIKLFFFGTRGISIGTNIVSIDVARCVSGSYIRHISNHCGSCRSVLILTDEEDRVRPHAEDRLQFHQGEAKEGGNVDQ